MFHSSFLSLPLPDEGISSCFPSLSLFLFLSLSFYNALASVWCKAPFRHVPPFSSSDLSFCKQYRSVIVALISSPLLFFARILLFFSPLSSSLWRVFCSSATCCDKEHSDDLLASIRGLFELEVFSDSCRSLTTALFCYSCHPDVGVGTVRGFCPVSMQRMHCSALPPFLHLRSDTFLLLLFLLFVL